MSSAPLSELDAALPGLVRKIRVLDALAWPEGVEENFLARWRAGAPDKRNCPGSSCARVITAPTFVRSKPLSAAAMRGIQRVATWP